MITYFIVPSLYIDFWAEYQEELSLLEGEGRWVFICGVSVIITELGVPIISIVTLVAIGVREVRGGVISIMSVLYYALF